MKALNVKQPYANKIADKTKPIETRSWYDKYRGPLLIVASKQPRIAPFGAAVAIVTLHDVRRMTPEDEKDAHVKYKPKFYAFVLGKIWKLPKPIAMSGALYIYETDKLGDAPHHQIGIVERSYLAGCSDCEFSRFERWLEKASICSKRGDCSRWYDAKKTTLST